MLEFPEETAPVTVRGFERIGRLTDHRSKENFMALYYFPGDTVAGGAFEVWLTPEEAADPEDLREIVAEQ